MRVLVVPSWYPTEAEPLKGIFFKEQAEALSRHGVDVRVACVNFVSLRKFFSAKTRVGLIKTVENGLEVYRYNTFNFFPKPYSLSVRYYTHALKKAIKAATADGWRPRLFHVHSVLMAGFAVRTLSRRFNLPYILTEHSSIFGRRLFTRQHEQFITPALKESAALIAVSEGLKRDLGMFVATDSIQVIPNICPFDVKQRLTGPAFTQPPGAGDRFVFFSLAFLTKNKGMDLLIRAFHRRFKGDLQVTLRIGGDGEERANLERLIGELGLEQQVFLLGSLDRQAVMQAMRDCDCFVLASKYETFGVVLVEALSFGKPVIATKCGGPEGIVTAATGILVDVDNVEQLSSAMVRVKNNLADYNSETIQQYCRQTFSEEAIVRQLKAVYTTVDSSWRK